MPEADPDDELLDVLLVKKVTYLQVPSALSKYKGGRYKELPHLVQHFRTKEVKVFCDKLTPINLDGELRTGQEITFRLADEKLRFFYPRGLSWKRT